MSVLDNPDGGEVRNSPIELTFYPKNAKGDIVGSAKTVTGTGFECWRTWMNGNGPGRNALKSKDHKNKKGSGKPRQENLLTGKEADKIAKEAAGYAETKQLNRDTKASN